MDGAREAPALVEIADVTTTYRMGDVDVHALRGVTIRIGEGEFAAIMGASARGCRPASWSTPTPTSGSRE